MPGLRAPLSVRINDGRTDRYVTKYCTGLRFRRTAPGGFADMSVTINLPIDTFTDLGAGDKAWVYGPTGKVLFEGFTQNPGKVNSHGGQAFELVVQGTQVLAEDESQPLIYCDTDASGWTEKKNNGTRPGATGAVGDDPSATIPALAAQGLDEAMGRGTLLGTSDFVEMGYDRLVDAGMELGSIILDVVSGKTDTGYRNDIGWYAGNAALTGGGTIPASATGISTSTTSAYTRVAGDGTLPTGQNRVALRLRRSSGATTVADDTTWSFFSNIHVLGRRVGLDGVLVSTANQTTNAYVLASDVVTDLFGRLLPVDQIVSRVDATTYQIDALAYPDAVTTGTILDDLATYEPGFLWEILESTVRGYRCNYRAWPTTPRYEFSTRDGYEAQGGDDDLCNRITVTWTDSRGRTRTTVVTATSAQFPALAALEAAGRTKDADPITLPVGRGSAATATRVGTQVLGGKATNPVAATLNVRRKVTDLATGNLVSPWELEPGYLCRIRETGDLLQMTEIAVDDDAGIAVVTAGQPVLTTEQRVARLWAKRAKKAA